MEAPRTRPIDPSELDPESADAGPRELTACLLVKRHALARGGLSDYIFGEISEGDLLELIRVAFQVSFRKDEGRYPRFTMVVPSSKERELLREAGIVFEPPIGVDVRTLRRLSPAIPGRPHALVVRPGADGLVCAGVGRFETAGALLPEDKTGMILRAEGLVVEVNGPGDVTVREAGEVFTLRAGRIERELNGAQALSKLGTFYATHKETIELRLSGAASRIQDKMREAVADLWMYVLKRAVEMAHGGAFAVLPTDADTVGGLPTAWESCFKVTYSTLEPDLFVECDRYVQSRWGSHGVSRHIALQKVKDAAVEVAYASATDGFVVLNRGLQMLGFGVKVIFDDTIPTRCDEVDENLELAGHFHLGRAGTRHTAGYMLCRSVPDSVVFVVSQDGDLRMFFTTREGDVRVTAPLVPVTQLFQGI